MHATWPGRVRIHRKLSLETDAIPVKKLLIILLCLFKENIQHISLRVNNATVRRLLCNYSILKSMSAPLLRYTYIMMASPHNIHFYKVKLETIGVYFIIFVIAVKDKVLLLVGTAIRVNVVKLSFRAKVRENINMFYLCSRKNRSILYRRDNVYLDMSRVMQKPFVFVFFAYAKTKTQLSFAVTAKLISAFDFATQIV